jgi:tRNA pseudouridine55 synthase
VKRNLINGWFFLDKPLGVTSNFVLQKIRKIFGNCKAGFVGTLDPLASGNLPIALGSATKTISYIEKANKEYLFTIRWGRKTSTGDSEGSILKEKKVFPAVEQIKNTLFSYIGEIEQNTPKFSSVKINGVRAYDLARRNIPFETKKRTILIKKIKLINQISKEKAVFYVNCSAGTYIRSLAESISNAMGTYGTLTELRRIGFGNCKKKLISLDYLLSLVHSDDLNKLVHPIDVVFNEVRKINLNEEQVKKVLTGSVIEMNQNSDLSNEMCEKIVFAKHANRFIALGLIEKRNFHPKKLLII